MPVGIREKYPVKYFGIYLDIIYFRQKSHEGYPSL